MNISKKCISATKNFYNYSFINKRNIIIGTGIGIAAHYYSFIIETLKNIEQFSISSLETFDQLTSNSDPSDTFTPNSYYIKLLLKILLIYYFCQNLTSIISDLKNIREAKKAALENLQNLAEDTEGITETIIGNNFTNVTTVKFGAIPSKDILINLECNHTKAFNLLQNSVLFVIKNSIESFKTKIKLDPTGKKEIKDILIKLLNKSEFLFVGQTHRVFDAKVIVDNLEFLKENGLTCVALEIPISEQKGLDHYVATGDTSKLTKPFNRVVKSIDCKLVIKRAKELSLKIFAFDAANAMELEGVTIEREISMADNLLHKLPSDGKKLVMTGRAHTMTFKPPFFSAKSLLKLSERGASTIALESFSSIVSEAYFGKTPEEIAVRQCMAYVTVANNHKDWLAKGSFAYSTKALGDLAHLNSMQRMNSTSYRDNYDYIFILNKKDSEISIT